MYFLFFLLFFKAQNIHFVLFYKYKITKRYYSAHFLYISYFCAIISNKGTMNTQLYLVRHGETEENVAQILQGRMPGHLTEKGKQQARDLAETLKRDYEPFDMMLVSDLQRTLDTANIINERLHIAQLLPYPLLRERDWGDFTGIDIMYARTHEMPENAESVEQMFSRARLFLNTIFTQYANKRVLAVGHGLFNRTILAAYQGRTIRDIPRIENAEVRHITITHPTLLQASANDDLVSAN